MKTVIVKNRENNKKSGQSNVCLNQCLGFGKATLLKSKSFKIKNIRCENISRADGSDKFAKLRPCCQSREKHLYFPREHFLIIMTGIQYKGFYLDQYSS